LSLGNEDFSPVKTRAPDGSKQLDDFKERVMTHRRWTSAFAVLSVFCITSCAGEPPDGPVEGRSAALLNADEFLYFRCTSTSWSADQSNRMLSTADPNVVTLTYQVTQPWMVTSGEPCIFTRTNQLNGWGTSQTSFAKSAPATPLVVPGSGSLVASSNNFTIRYPALGTFTVTVNWAQKTFSIAAGTGATAAPLPFWLSYCSDPTCGGTPLVVKVCPDTTPNCSPARQTTVVPEVDGRQINQVFFPLQLPAGVTASVVSGFGTVTGPLVFSSSSPVVLRSDVNLTLSYYQVAPVWGGTTHLNFVTQSFTSPEVVSTVYRHPTFLTGGEPAQLHDRGRTIIVQESQIANINPGRMNAFFLPSEMATLGEGNFSDGNLNITMNYGNPDFIAGAGGVLNAVMPRFAHEYVHELFSEIAPNYPGFNICLNEGLADAFAFAAGFLPEDQFGPIGLRGGDFNNGCAQFVTDFESHDVGNCPLWQVRRLGRLSQGFAAAMLHPQHVLTFDSCDLTSSQTGNALLVLFSESAGQDLTQAIQMAQIPNAGSLAAARQALGLP
jgi:hypothetical protein